MKYPKFIKENATIGVPAPSDGGKSEKKVNKYKNGIKRLESLGYKLVLSDNLFNSDKGRSSDAKTRGKEFNEMIKNKDIDLVLCATGGDFCIEMLPYVDFDLIRENPKYVVGFSDPTNILYPLTTKYDIATIYGQNFSPFGMEKLHKSQEDFLNIITGKQLEEDSYDMYESEYTETITGLEYYNLDKEVEWKTLDNKDLTIKGRIIGGCFDIISELAGTKYDGINEFNERYKGDGIIWYFDNCELSLDETLRVLFKFKELGYFKYCNGVMFGRFGMPTSYYDYDTKTCLEDSVLKELNIPVIYDADLSHKAPCLNIINGSVATISTSNGKGKIKFELI